VNSTNDKPASLELSAYYELRGKEIIDVTVKTVDAWLHSCAAGRQPARTAGESPQCGGSLL